MSISSVKICQNNGYDLNSIKILGKGGIMLANSTTLIEHSWPYIIGVLKVYFVTSPIHNEDIINVYVAEDSVISTTTNNSSIGDNSLYLTAMSNIYGVGAKVGFKATLQNGELSNDLGEIILSDSVNNLIVFENNLTDDFPAGSTLKIKIHSVENYPIQAEGNHSFFDGMISCYMLPPSIPIRMYYTNNGDVDKEFKLNIQFMH